MRGSTSHCTSRHKLDFVLAPAKQFSLSALPGHCKKLITLGVPKGKFVKAHCHRLANQKVNPCLNLNLNQVKSTIQLSSFCSDLAKMKYSLAMTNYLISPSVLSDKNFIHRLDKTGTVDYFIFILSRAVSTCP